jgi:hypothetical protein
MRVLLIPNKGELLRDLRTKQIVPETGILVELDSFWRRRIRDGSATISVKKKEPITFEKKRLKEEKHAD